MGKSITIKEDSLILIKENVVGSSNTASHNTVCVNEARPEVDEFELGQENDNPPLGANYCHVNEVYNTSVRGDMSRVDYIDYVPHDNPREEGYTADNITEFEPYYELECYDNNGELIFNGELTLNELFDYFPDKIIHALSERSGRKVSQSQWRIEDILSWDTTPNDINNVEEVNAIAKRIQTGGPSGYILVDGDVIYFHDHIGITSIDDMTPSKFVSLGNIRIGVGGGVELAKEPTSQQIYALKNYLRGQNEVYVDIVKDSGRMYPEAICGAAYERPNVERIINDIIYYFRNGIRPQGTMRYESKNKYKRIIENIDFEVDSSEIDLSSFKKKTNLAPIWDNDDMLDSRIRLKLLDIADDFWEFVNLKWVKPSGIILTGSICNFNWSQYSDIDLHLIVDFDEIDEKTDFVRDYLDSKKNEWNNEHNELTILGYQVELYVQNLNEMPQSSGIYDLEENEWIRKPNSSDIKPIGLDKFSIKDKAAEIMTIIDDMYTTLNSTDDLHEIEEIGEDARYLWKKIKKMRKLSLEKNGESGSGNICYKYLRRSGYLDKLWKLSATIYDKTNSINESVEKNLDYLSIAKERFGITNDIRECGYVLPDGTMLDFSGRHSLNKGTDSSHLAGRRAVDHREIEDIGWSIDGNTKNFDFSMEEFIKLGAIRTHVSNSYCLLNLFTKPTNQQISILFKIIQYAKGCVDVEIGDGNESLAYGEYDGVRPNVVIAKINRYFDEGINLNESVKKYLKLLKENVINEEWVGDGNSEHNPYKERWDAERKALKDFVSNYGKLMQSRENGKLYKCYYDKTLSQMIGYNYCICIQWDSVEMKPKSVLYIRALDKFTPNIKQVNFDYRGHDNQMGTRDDLTYR